MIKSNKIKYLICSIALLSTVIINGCTDDTFNVIEPNIDNGAFIIENNSNETINVETEKINSETSEYDFEFSGEPFEVLNDNKYDANIVNITNESYEYYSELDSLGRCGIAHACIGIDLMPTENRGSIGSVKPTGWQSTKYDIVSGKYLYNRCHLIGYQLTAENANDKNLITGTRYLNIEGMLPFENMVADYIKETENHVMYVVIPVFEEDNLVAKGVQMMAYSVEDNGEGIEFNVFCYNIQPGITINYADGTSQLTEDLENQSLEQNEDTEAPIEEVEEHAKEVQDYDDVQDDELFETYIVNQKTMKIHKPNCIYANIESDSMVSCDGPIERLENEGYVKCKVCFK